MKFYFLVLILAFGAFNPPPIQEELFISCSCKKKRKTTFKDNLIACFCDEEPLLEEADSRKGWS